MLPAGTYELGATITLKLLKKIPSFYLSAFHNYCPESDMNVVVYYGVIDITRMLNVDVVSNGGGEGEGLIWNPKGWLDGWIITNFGISAYPHWIIKSIYNCSKANVAILSDKDIAVNSSIRGDVYAIRESESIWLYVEDIPVSIDGL